MPLGAPKQLSLLRRFFLRPRLPKHRQYEALRADLVEGRPAKEAARAFGYSLKEDTSHTTTVPSSATLAAPLRWQPAIAWLLGDELPRQPRRVFLQNA